MSSIGDPPDDPRGEDGQPIVLDRSCHVSAGHLRRVSSREAFEGLYVGNGELCPRIDNLCAFGAVSLADGREVVPCRYDWLAWNFKDDGVPYLAACMDGHRVRYLLFMPFPDIL